MAAIHFWLPSGLPFPVDDWDPDLDPNRSSSSVSHGLIELYTRLSDRGAPVSIGRAVDPDARLLVVLARTVSKRPVFADTLRALRQVGGRFVLVGADTDSWRVLPLRPTIEVVANRAAVREPWQRWVPELPQRGIRPRREERKGRIRSLTFKGNPLNVHPALLAEEWRAELAKRGLEWSLDVPSTQEGTDHAWPDYSEVDAVLCVRHPRWDGLLARKPAGKLLNAWLGRAIPFAAREPAYLELGNDGSDVFFVDSPWDALPIFEELNREPARLASVEARIAARAEEFAPARVLDLWASLLLEALETSEARGARARRRLALLAAQAKIDVSVPHTPFGRVVAGAGRRLRRLRRAVSRLVGSGEAARGRDAS
jgi:hypothetical protein